MTKTSQLQGPILIDETSISKAWSKAFLHVIDHSGNEIIPLVLSVSGFAECSSIEEDASVRKALDDLLIAEGHQSTENVAYTIFPQRLWMIAQGNRARLFELYRKVFPRYRAMNKKDNNRGLYFQRLIEYGRGECDGNQLEWIISQYNARDGVRRSMLQASVFDPARDHVANAQLQFPCLQHVTFVPTPNGLVINAFYATQQIFVKAYGNYLGIAQLGAFVAHEMNLKLLRMNVIIGIAKINKISKTSAKLEPLIEAARNCVSSD